MFQICQKDIRGFYMDMGLEIRRVCAGQAT